MVVNGDVETGMDVGKADDVFGLIDLRELVGTVIYLLRVSLYVGIYFEQVDAAVRSRRLASGFDLQNV